MSICEFFLNSIVQIFYIKYKTLIYPLGINNFINTAGNYANHDQAAGGCTPPKTLNQHCAEHGQ